MAIKGNIPWNKGKIGIYSQESRDKMSKSLTGRKQSPETIAKRVAKNKGKKRSLEARLATSRALKGRPKSEEHRRKIALINIGRTSVMSEETKRKISLSNKGKSRGLGRKRPEWERLKISESHKKRRELHHNWKGGITPENERIRSSVEYKLWRTAVFKRDNYQCIWGGKEHGKKLQADHIKRFSEYPELRFAIDNGRTLCVDCHKKTDNYGRKGLK